MNTSPAPLVVFDLDGTLVDTADDLLAALNAALAGAGEAPVEVARYRAYAGHGGVAMIKRAFSERQRPLADARLAEINAAFLAAYTRDIPRTSRPFEGVLDCLAQLAQSGHTLAVCTNKPQNLADKLLAALGLTGHFAAICGADRFANRKPHPDHLGGTINLANGDPARTVMIGDSRTDIDAAKRMGVPVAAFSGGYSDVPLPSLEPDMIFSTYEQLNPDTIAALLA